MTKTNETAPLDGNEIWEWLFGKLRGCMPVELTDEVFSDLAQHINTHWIAPELQPEVAADPVGEADFMPGTGGFTMAIFRAIDVPFGTKLYATPPVVEEAVKAERKGIYVASKVAHAELWRDLRHFERMPIISTWIDEAGVGESHDLSDLWFRCVSEASNAGALIVYRRPNEVLKGAWVEVGAALASGVPVFAVGIEEFTVANHAGITHCCDLIDARRLALAALSKAEPLIMTQANTTVSDERLAEMLRGLEEMKDGLTYQLVGDMRSILTELSARRATADVTEVQARLQEALDAFDEEVSQHLAEETERADLWADIEVNAEDLRALLAAINPPMGR